MSMTQQEFQDELHALYQGDTNTPAEDSDDWNLRESFGKTAVREWDDEKGVLWNELWAMLSDAADGDKTGNGVLVDFNCPSNFRFLGGFVRTVNSAGNSTYWDIKTPKEAELYRNDSEKIVWVTGNEKDGFDIHFGTAPSNGDTIEYPYYKTPTPPTAAANKFEMSDPMFAVYVALALLHENDGQGDRAGLALAKAQAKLSGMKTRNVMPVWFQANKVPDRQFKIGVKGFGQ